MQQENYGDDEDVNCRIRMRVLTLLECSPGNKGSEAGDPITIIVAEHGGNIEAIGLSIADTRRLVVDCLVSLAEIATPLAVHLLDTYFTDADGTIRHSFNYD